MKKRFKVRKKINIKKLVYVFLIFSLTLFLFYQTNKIKFTKSNESLVKGFLNNINYYSYNQNNSYLNKLYSNIKQNIFNSPTNILRNELFYKKNTNEVLNSNSFSYGKNELPIVYIYNSHQGETYSTKYLEEYNIVPDVLMASHMLKDKLENIGIKTIVEENDILEYMKLNNLDHSGSYIASRHFLKETINKYPSIKLFIDLHRDAASHSATYTSINQKDYAKILFVIGLEYETYEKNMSLSNKLNTIIEKNYPSLTRGILKKEGYGVNGVYNQDLNSNIILMEIGGNENNIDEVNNTLDIIASTIGEYLNEKE